MATDRHSQTIAVGDTYVLCGRVVRIDGDNVVLVTGDNNEIALRVRAGDVAKIDRLGPVFSVPAGSLSAPTIPEHYVRGVELTASQAAQDAIFLAYVGATFVPIAAVSSYIQSLLPAANAAAARTTLGAAAASHGHDPVDIAVQSSDFTKGLSGFSGSNLQELLMHLDDILPPP